MALSVDAQKRLMIALTSADAGNEVANAVNDAQALGAGTGWTVAAFIVGTGVSQTADFGALAVGDRVLMIAATPGNPILYTVATAGTLPVAGVNGNFYIVLRAFTNPTDVTLKF